MTDDRHYSEVTAPENPIKHSMLCSCRGKSFFKVECHPMPGGETPAVALDGNLCA